MTYAKVILMLGPDAGLSASLDGSGRPVRVTIADKGDGDIMSIVAATIDMIRLGRALQEIGMGAREAQERRPHRGAQYSATIQLQDMDVR